MARKTADLVEAIANGPTSRAQVEAYVRAAARMRRSLEPGHIPTKVKEQDRSILAYDRAKAALLGEGRE